VQVAGTIDASQDRSVPSTMEVVEAKIADLSSAHSLHRASKLLKHEIHRQPVPLLQNGHRTHHPNVNT
jgi:hypothetical protein